ncbi:MAG: AAA family ATPase, partial [Clostridia bacterium]|nr:AAA family ATPase [Clostridia bacterium]
MSIISQLPYKKFCVAVVGPTGCGKTTLTENLAIALYLSAVKLFHAMYIDKDDFVLLSNRIFHVAKQPVDRADTFFKNEIRDYEYDLVQALALRSLLFADCCVINAPFREELHRSLSGDVSERLRTFKQQLNERGAALVVIFVNATRETAKKRW